MKSLLKYSIFIIFLSFFSCTAPIEYGPKVELEGNIWNLYELNGKEYVPDEKHDPAYIEFEETGNFNGFGSCNDFFGTYEKSGNSIKIKSGLTARYCEGLMDFEFEMGDVILGADKYKIANGELFLYKDGKITAKFFTLIIN